MSFDAASQVCVHVAIRSATRIVLLVLASIKEQGDCIGLLRQGTNDSNSEAIAVSRQL